MVLLQVIYDRYTLTLRLFCACSYWNCEVKGSSSVLCWELQLASQAFNVVIDLFRAPCCYIWCFSISFIHLLICVCTSGLRARDRSLSSTITCVFVRVWVYPLCPCMCVRKGQDLPGTQSLYIGGSTSFCPNSNAVPLCCREGRPKDFTSALERYVWPVWAQRGLKQGSGEFCSEGTSVFHLLFVGVNKASCQLDAVILTTMNSFLMMAELHQ